MRVKNFRSLLDLDLAIDEFTTLVGRNGVGKSAVLRALELFYAPSPNVSAADFYANDDSRSIEIELTYSDLSQPALRHFERYVQDGRLTVLRRMELIDGKLSARYFGSTRQNPDFRTVRDAPNATDLRTRYDALREESKYKDLPRVRSQDDARNALRDWEGLNGDALEWTPDDGQFFGFTQVAQGYLGRYTRLISIPAIRDAALDASEGRGSAAAEIMQIVVVEQLRNNRDLIELQAEMRERYEAIIEPVRQGPLQQLEQRLSGALRQLVPDSEIRVAWESDDQIDLPVPHAEMQLVEDQYPSPVDRAGHGLQRAFLMTLLQELSSIREEQSADTRDYIPPDVLLAIEEPELFQHPSRQRHFASILNELTRAEGHARGRTQVLSATHSPLFVSAERVEAIRLMGKGDAGQGMPRRSTLSQTTLDEVAEMLATCHGGDVHFTAEGLRARLRSTMTPWMNEGFFADCVVLVEGEEDRAAVIGGAASMGLDLERKGIAVVPCMGKTNLDKPFAVFTALGIPVFMVWDNDAGKQEQAQNNRVLLRLCGAQEEDWPEGSHGSFACFGPDLTSAIRDDVGVELYGQILDDLRDTYGIATIAQAVKNPVLVGDLVTRAVAQSRPPTRLIDSITAIMQYRG